MASLRQSEGAPGLERRPAARGLRSRLLGGSTEGNERLTVLLGALLFVAFALLGVTIVLIHRTIVPHLFVGFFLLGPLALKLSSTGYRFMRYYTGAGEYRRKGPPATALRLLAPLFVASTIVVFASGVVLAVDGPASRETWFFVHKASFIVWIALGALHVLGHLPEMLSWLAGRAPVLARATEGDFGLGALVQARADAAGTSPLRGGAGRALAIAGACAAGVVIALLFIPDYAAWTVPGALGHLHH
ncbi:MAG TPA: hypothetical protein VKU89_00085 [Solirubrobacteraceae bacterium]|nr:hypothetical protein [Solirubrobacteraceae bacterium]